MIGEGEGEEWLCHHCYFLQPGMRGGGEEEEKQYSLPLVISRVNMQWTVDLASEETELTSQASKCWEAASTISSADFPWKTR